MKNLEIGFKKVYVKNIKILLNFEVPFINFSKRNYFVFYCSVNGILYCNEYIDICNNKKYPLIID